MRLSTSYILLAALALLTLCGGTASAQGVQVPFDLVPGQCPNPFGSPLRGSLVPAAIPGTTEAPADRISRNTIVLIVPDGGGGSGDSGGGVIQVFPVETNIADDATPFFPQDECDCVGDTGDGTDDVRLQFESVQLEEALTLAGYQPGDEVELMIAAELDDGTPLVGVDCVEIIDTVDIDEHAWGKVKALYR